MTKLGQELLNRLNDLITENTTPEYDQAIYDAAEIVSQMFNEPIIYPIPEKESKSQSKKKKRRITGMVNNIFPHLGLNEVADDIQDIFEKKG